MNPETHKKGKSGNSRLRNWIGGSLFILLVVAFAWAKYGYPYSVAEAVFLSNLAKVSASNAQRIDLAALMPGSWEMACESSGYDEPLTVEKYKKSFPTAGRPQDGAWGLIFIEPNGTFTSVSSSCGRGVQIKFLTERCVPREMAFLYREKKTGACEKFAPSQH